MRSSTRSLLPRALVSLSLSLALAACNDEPPPPPPDAVDDAWIEAIEAQQDEDPVAAAARSPTPEAIAASKPMEPAPNTQTATPTSTASDEATSPARDAGEPAPTTPGSSNPEADTPDANLETEIAEPGALEPAPEAPSARPAPEPTQPASPPPLTLADLQGSYRYVGGSGQREAIEEAIEVAIQSLPAAFRGIGRRRLTKTNQIDNTVEIDVSGDRVTTRFTSGFDPTCVLGGATITWVGKKGSKYEVRMRSKGAKLVQIGSSDDGTKTSVFVLSADRKRLTIHHKIVAHRLDNPLVYKLSYVRR